MQWNYKARIERAQAVVREQNLAGMVIGTGSEMQYFTGVTATSHERLTALVITATGALMVAPMTDIGSMNVDSLGVELQGWADGENAHAVVDKYLRAHAEDASATVALGSSLTADHVLKLQELFDGATSLLPSGLFHVKEPGEIAELRRAGAAIGRVHAQVADLLVAGRTEREVAADIETLILAEHEVVDFIIVGSGVNGANPHHDFSDRVLEAGDPVVVDIGGTLDSGYHSDSTRTHVVAGAQPSAGFDEAYKAVRRAHAAALAAVRPGITAQEIDWAAREVIEEAGLGEYFTHRTGHGIGLSTHEEPFIIAGNDLELKPGMAFSIEPGVYVPGQWGIRHEDIVVMSSDGTGEALL